MKHLKRFNENIEYDHSILPNIVLDSLRDECDVDYRDKRNKIEAYEDPKIDGVYALRVYRYSDDAKFECLWTQYGFEDVEFDTFPPTSSDLKFFQ